MAKRRRRRRRKVGTTNKTTKRTTKRSTTAREKLINVDSVVTGITRSPKDKYSKGWTEKKNTICPLQ